MALPSDEVAEDYKGALEDLVTNDRYQIANLTMIAKENIEHAEAVSRVLTNHIKRTPPTRKLPALYVLDSLVKNVGSPYTVYFGRDLHATFMLAYSQVDVNVRRKLEEMLKTWREPVPGSLSTTPVFPLSSTQSIMENLSKYRASSTPVAQRYPPSAQNVRPHVQAPYRNTPTPPQPQPTSVANHSVPAQAQYTLPPQSHDTRYGTPPARLPHDAPTPQLIYPQPAQPQAGVDIVQLNADIDDLTTDAKIECATHPMDEGARRTLATLQTLKEILDSGSASGQDLVDIQSTIVQQMSKRQSVKQQQPHPHQALSTDTHVQYIPPPSIEFQSHMSGQSAPVPPSALSFLNSANLAELLRATAVVQSAPQPHEPFPMAPLHQHRQQHQHQPPHQQHQHQAQPMYSTPVPLPGVSTQAVIPPSALPLLEQLRASGLLSATSTPLQGATPPTHLSGLLAVHSPGLPFTSASIRVPRPDLLTTFLGENPNQCSTCGRRFTSDATGREKKARHLDWHFKTKARLIEAERRGLNRSWYVGEREWISSKEVDDDVDNDDPTFNASNLSPSTSLRPKQDYVRVPTDPTLRSAPCPIDQEPFKSEWSEEVQDFIWNDAIKVGGRYYHASCYQEVMKNRERETTPVPAHGIRTTTPDSVLGKRKAERDSDMALTTRVKLEA